MSIALATPTGSAPVQNELWGARSRDYAEVQEPTFLPLYESVLERPEVAKAGSILDVGCGPGLAAQVFSRKIGRVAGLDATGPFVEIAQRRVPGGDFRVGEMEALPHTDGSFDVITGFNAFQYAASPVNALREARCKAWRGRHHCGLGIAGNLRGSRAPQGIGVADATAASRRSRTLCTLG
jgi:SAM-dependent methyltransferase